MNEVRYTARRPTATCGRLTWTSVFDGWSNREAFRTKMLTTRAWVRVDMPVIDGVLARSWLVEIDERFEALDPLVVLEESPRRQPKPRANGTRTVTGLPKEDKE